MILALFILCIICVVVAVTRSRMPWSITLDEFKPTINKDNKET